jgi:hypothetical protein
MDSAHSPQGASKKSASREEREELATVVDGKVVSDDHPLAVAETVDAPKSTLDKIVMAMVVVGIILFASFQISQCVASYNNPATKTSVETVARTFPGIMLCPFSYDVYNRVYICPEWSPQASLAFDFTASQERSYPKCPSSYSAYVTNTNSDIASLNTLSKSCPLNQVNVMPGSETSKSNLYFDLFLDPCGVELSKLVTVKNTAKLTRAGNGPLTCNSWTPPNVQCLVFDPSSFDEAEKAIPGLKPICNPMKEVKPNSINAVQLSVEFDIYPCGSNCTNCRSCGGPSTRFGAYKYSGLIPQTSTPPSAQSNPFITAPSSLSISTRDLVNQGKKTYCGKNNVNMSLFGGIVAVLYDASKGIPQELDFDGARQDAMSDSDLGSTLILSTNSQNGGLGVPSDPSNLGSLCVQYQSAPLSALVTSQVDERFTDAVAGAKQKITSQTVSLQRSIIDGTNFANFGTSQPQLLMRFSSSLSVTTTPIISVTILTTISIIVSTAATLWGSQQKIKEGIILATTKVKEFLEKRRAV